MTGPEIAARALSQVGRPIAYRLGAYPASWRSDDIGPEADCSSFVWWCAKQPRGSANCDGIIRDARGEQRRCYRPLDVQVGDWLVYGGVFQRVPVIKRIRPGHVAIVTDVSGVDGIWAAQPHQWAQLRAVHCSKSHYAATGSAVQESDGSLWGRKNGLVVRLKG